MRSIEVVVTLVLASVALSCSEVKSEAECLNKYGCGWNGSSCGTCEDLSKTDKCIPYSGCGVDTFNTALLQCKGCEQLTKEECSYSFGCKLVVEKCIPDVCA